MPDAPESNNGKGSGVGNDTSKASWLAPLLQGVTLVTLLGATWYLSGKIATIDATLSHQNESLKNLNTSVKELDATLRNPQQGLSVRLTELNGKIDNLDDKVSRIEEWSKAITPRIVRAEFDKELDRLNKRVESLEARLRKADVAGRQTNAALAREQSQSKAFQDRIRDADNELASISEYLEAIWKRADMQRRDLPEGYAAELISQVDKIQQRLNELRKRLTG